MHRVVIASIYAAGLGVAVSPAYAGKTVTYYYTDPQGSVLATADGQGNIIQSREYRPYGAVASGSHHSAPGYTSHIEDGDTALVYMQQRYYDPDVGAFLSIDPLGISKGELDHFNRFRYGSSNPYRYIDPDGRQSWCTPGTCGAQAYMESAQQIRDAISWLNNQKDIVASGKVAGGLGIEVSYNFSQGKGEVALNPVALGANVSLDAQTRQPMTINLVQNPVQGKFAIAASYDVGEFVKAGIEAKYNPGGTVEVTPKIGVGFANYQSYAPSVTIFEWGGPEPEEPRANPSPKKNNSTF